MGEGPSVGGQRPRANNFTIEGVDNNQKDLTLHNRGYSTRGGGGNQHAPEPILRGIRARQRRSV